MVDKQEQFAKIQEKQQEIAGVLQSCEAGQKVLNASQGLGISPEMQAVIQTLSDPDALEVDRVNMAQYFGRAMEGDVRAKMTSFVTYLQQVADNPDYVKRAPYFLKLKDGVAALQGVPAFTTYIAEYEAFMADESGEAKDARDKIAVISEEMKKLVEAG